MKTVTFSFASEEYEGVGATETFTFEQLEIDANLTGHTLEEELERLHQKWVWNQLNINYSIIIDDRNAGR